MITFEPATPDHALQAVANLRADDPHPWTYEQIVDLIGTSVEAWTGLHDGRVGAMFGMQDATQGLTRRGATWLCTTTVAQEQPLAFARLSRPVWKDLREGWDEVLGAFPETERCAEFWLRSLGFTIDPPHRGYRVFRWRSV